MHSLLHLPRPNRATSRRMTGAAVTGALLVAVSLAGCSSSPEPAATSDAPASGAAALVPDEYRQNGINVGLITGSLPLADVTEDQKGFQGVDYDILEALGTTLDVTFNYEATSFDNMIPGVSNGRYDLAAAAFYDTADREKVVDMVTYLTDGAVFVVNKGDDTDLSEDDLCGLSIGVIQGGAQAARLPAASDACKAAGHDPIDLQVFPSASAGVLALTSNRIDGFDVSASVGLYVVTQTDGLATGDPFQVVPVGFVLAKKTPLADALVAGINELIASGEYAKILDTWGLSDAGIEKSEYNPMTP